MAENEATAPDDDKDQSSTLTESLSKLTDKVVEHDPKLEILWKWAIRLGWIGIPVLAALATFAYRYPNSAWQIGLAISSTVLTGWVVWRFAKFISDEALKPKKQREKLYEFTLSVLIAQVLISCVSLLFTFQIGLKLFTNEITPDLFFNAACWFAFSVLIIWMTLLSLLVPIVILCWVVQSHSVFVGASTENALQVKNCLERMSVAQGKQVVNQGKVIDVIGDILENQLPEVRDRLNKALTEIKIEPTPKPKRKPKYT